MYLRTIFVFVCLLVVSQMASSTYVPPAGCKGTRNPLPPITGSPVLIKTVPNGKLFMDYSVDAPIRLAHVYGSAYQMGFAMGQLLKDDLETFLPDVMTYFSGQTESELPPILPAWLRKMIAEKGTPFALDFTYTLTKPYTPQHFEDEIQGMADGSGMDIKLIRRLNMIPELIKAHCSMIGAWGPAINETAPGSTLYQLRALDWNTDGPFQEKPAILVYHPDNGVPFASWGWTGFVGALSGYSSSSVGICEKYWGGYNGTYFMEGYPFHYLLRDILQFDGDIKSAYERIENAQRTCAIFVGLGDNKSNEFRAVEYSHDILNIYSDTTYPVYPAHPQKKGLIYIDKHFQPSNDPCLANLVLESYGKLDTQHLLWAASVHKTGDAHAAIYDYAKNYMYVSAASVASKPPIVPAYDRQFVGYNMLDLWAEPRP